jgi:hypothetical protein
MKVDIQKLKGFLRRIFSSEKYGLLILCIVLIVIDTILFYRNGVRVVTDSARYLEYSSNLRNGFYVDPHNIWYVSYAIFIMVIGLFSESLTTVVFVQFFLGIFTVISIYYTALTLFKNRNAAFLSSFGFILFVEPSFWASYILPESLYISLCCFAFYFLSNLNQQERINPLRIIITIIVVLVAGLTKPTGYALFIAALAVILLKMFRHNKLNRLAISLTVTIVVTAPLLLNRMLATYLIRENYQNGEIVFEVSNYSNAEEASYLIVDPPAKLEVSENTSPLLQVIEVAVRHPVYFTKLFLAKVFFLFLHVRPYWSWLHNVTVLIFLIPLYFFFFRGMKRDDVTLSFKTFVLTYLFVHAFGIGLTFEDWDGRFLMPMIPILLMPAGLELARRFESSFD